MPQLTWTRRSGFSAPSILRPSGSHSRPSLTASRSQTLIRLQRSSRSAAVSARSLTDLYHQQRAGVWVTINDTEGNGRKAAAVTRVRAVWQEDDDGYEGDFPLEPSLVVETSPGHYHRYWLVDGDWPSDQQGRTDFAGVMRRMIADYGSDPGAKDISRVLRVPGFQHRKNPDEPHMVAVVGGNYRRYSRAVILFAFPPIHHKTSAPRGNGRAGDGEGHAELVRQLLTGDNYHSALVSLAWRQIGAGMPAGQVVEHLRGIMLSIPEERRDERWKARFAEIPRLVSSAEGKHGIGPDAHGARIGQAAKSEDELDIRVSAQAPEVRAAWSCRRVRDAGHQAQRGRSCRCHDDIAHCDRGAHGARPLHPHRRHRASLKTDDGRRRCHLAGAEGYVVGTGATPDRTNRGAHPGGTDAQLPLGKKTQITHGPLSTGEGLINAIRDGLKEDDKGIEDKRLLVVEGELGAALRAMQRLGNTLSMTLRTSWDGHQLAPLIKTDRTVASDPHICIVGPHHAPRAGGPAGEQRRVGRTGEPLLVGLRSSPGDHCLPHKHDQGGVG